MPLVVSDTSALSLLVRIGQADVLPGLFHHIVIPPEIAAEMAHAKAPAAVQAFITPPPAWLGVRLPTSLLPLPQLDGGEAAAISLAVELRATLLIDELAGRREATAHGLRIIGAVGVLEQAADAGLLTDLAAVHTAIRSLPFRIADSLLEASLARHRSQHQLAPKVTAHDPRDHRQHDR